MPASRNLRNGWLEPLEAVHSSVHLLISPPDRRSFIAINDKDAEAKLCSVDQLVASPAMIFVAAHYHTAQQPQPPSPRSVSRPNTRQIENGATLQEEPSKPWIVIRNNVTIGPYCQLRGPSRITIGRNSKIGAHVVITTDSDSTNKGQEVRSDSQVYISNNVEIRNSYSIGAGVRIGPSTIVAPGSVLYRPLAEPQGQGQV